MGQKVHPSGYRIGVIEPWRSRWYANKKNYGRLLLQDEKIRNHIEKEYRSAGIPRIEIERTSEAVNVIVHTARPGVLVGRKGVRVDQLKETLQKITDTKCHLTVVEIKRPELEAKLVAEMLSEALEKRMAYRRAMKKAVQTTIQAGALGIKVEINGRLGGAEMARTGKDREGRVPLSTLQAFVDYGTATAKTTYGVIGVKVWIYKGNVDRGVKIDFRRVMETVKGMRAVAPASNQRRGGRGGRGGRSGGGGRGDRR